MGYRAAGDLWRHSKGLWIMLEIRTLGIFSSWAAHRFCGGMIGTTVFGILGPITLFPLKTCFWKQQYMFPGIFWVERFYGYQSSGHVKNQTSQKFLLQKYVTWNCDILQKYSAYKIEELVRFEFPNFCLVTSQLMTSQNGLFGYAQY